MEHIGHVYWIIYVVSIQISSNIVTTGDLFHGGLMDSIEFSTIFNILVDETPINPSYLDLTHGIPAGAREIGGQTQGFHGQGVSLEDLIVSATLQGLAGFGDLFKRSFGKNQAVTVTKLNYNALFLASKNQICPKSQFRPFWFL